MEARTISRLERTKSSLVMGVGFLVLFWVSLMVLSIVPLVGALFHAAILFGSPFTWVLSALGYAREAHPHLVGLAIAAPYPLAGLLIGYAWPLEISKKWSVLRAIIARFGLACLLIWAAGICLALFAAAHDS